jgi:adenylate kinase family enzyme
VRTRHIEGKTAEDAPMTPDTTEHSAVAKLQAQAVVFFGISGAGKGTQADLLVHHLARLDPARRVLRADQGALLRARAGQGDELARRTRAIMTAGELVPNFVATGVLAEYVSRHFSREAHFVFDGVARYDLQARMFDELMVFFDRPDYTIIVLELSLELARTRLARRARNDEATEEQTRNRFRWWAEKTIPAIAMLEEMGRKVHRVDGSLPVEQVHKTIVQRLGVCG